MRPGLDFVKTVTNSCLNSCRAARLVDLAFRKNIFVVSIRDSQTCCASRDRFSSGGVVFCITIRLVGFRYPNYC